MNFDPAQLGLVDDGSTTEVMIYNVQHGRIPHTVEAFQSVFNEFRPAGFEVLFAAVDVANSRLIWVHRYDADFDLRNRFYLGKFPDLVHCVWSGTRFDALTASADGSTTPAVVKPSTASETRSRGDI